MKAFMIAASFYRVKSGCHFFFFTPVRFYASTRHDWGLSFVPYGTSPFKFSHDTLLKDYMRPEIEKDLNTQTHTQQAAIQLWLPASERENVNIEQQEKVLLECWPIIQQLADDHGCWQTEQGVNKNIKTKRLKKREWEEEEEEQKKEEQEAEGVEEEEDEEERSNKGSRIGGKGPQAQQPHNWGGGVVEAADTRAGEGTVPLGLLTRLLFLVLFVCGCAGKETQEEV